jgi:serine/threonine protein phosphatase PrpC
MMTRTTDAREAQLFLEAALDAVEVMPFLDGEACVFTAPCPDQDTPNEDAMALLPFDDSSGVLVVADGVGGTRLGNAASGATIKALRKSLEDGAAHQVQLRTAVLDGIEAANQAILALGVGAATTLALVEIQEHQVRTVHVGDSEIVVVGQRGRIKLQTVAHSPVGLALEAGVLDAQEAMHHEDRHIVLNVIGTPEMRIEIGSLRKLALRDTVLVGSDGLFDNLHLPEIIECIRKGPLLQGVQKLVEASRERMLTPQEGAPSKPDDLTIAAYRRKASPR